MVVHPGNSYELGWHIPTQRLCRIMRLPGRAIEPNCVRVKYYRNIGETYLRSPYDPNGMLNTRYWSLPRASDLNRKSKV